MLLHCGCRRSFDVQGAEPVLLVIIFLYVNLVSPWTAVWFRPVVATKSAKVQTVFKVVFRPFERDRYPNNEPSHSTRVPLMLTFRGNFDEWCRTD